MKVLFLDESGDHSLTKIDLQYPMFVLGGIIVEQEYALGEMTERVKEFKQELFGRDDIILHTADIARNKNGFERMQDPAFRQRFYEKLNTLMRSLDYKVVACAIKKDMHFQKYGLGAVDPYMYSLEVLVERFCHEIGHNYHSGVVVAEKRNPTLDHQLDLAWLNLKISGSTFLKASQIEYRITNVVSRPKSSNIAGLQLADLVVTPIGRFVMEKRTKEDFTIIESKFRRKWDGEYRGYGLVVLPKE